MGLLQPRSQSQMAGRSCCRHPQQNPSQWRSLLAILGVLRSLALLGLESTARNPGGSWQEVLVGGAYHPMPPSPDSALQGDPTPIRTASHLWSQAATPRTGTGAHCYHPPSAWLIPIATATESPLSQMDGLEVPGGFLQPRPNANNRTAASMDTRRQTTSAPAVTGKNCGGGSVNRVGSCWCTGSEGRPWRARGAKQRELSSKN